MFVKKLTVQFPPPFGARGKFSYLVFKFGLVNLKLFGGNSMCAAKQVLVVRSAVSLQFGADGIVNAFVNPRV